MCDDIERGLQIIYGQDRGCGERRVVGGDWRGEPDRENDGDGGNGRARERDGPDSRRSPNGCGDKRACYSFARAFATLDGRRVPLGIVRRPRSDLTTTSARLPTRRFTPVLKPKTTTVPT